MANNKIRKHREKQKQGKEIEEGFDPQVAKVIRELPRDKQETIIQALSVRQHSGPLPDGESIQIYSTVIPNGGDRLMKTVEKQLDHRIEIENKGITRTFNQSSTGQWMAFGIAITFGVIAWDLARNDHEIVASILGSVDLVALVTVFIVGRKSK